MSTSKSFACGRLRKLFPFGSSLRTKSLSSSPHSNNLELPKRGGSRGKKMKEKRIEVRPLSKDRYGTVEGLDRDELLSPAELDRLVYRGMFEPLLSLPCSSSSAFVCSSCGSGFSARRSACSVCGSASLVRGSGSSGFRVRGSVDIDGFVDYGAFDTVDFKRLVPSFDKARYKVDKLRDELADAVMRLEMISERIKTRKKYAIMKYLKEGVLDLEDIKDFDMWCMGRMYLRTLRLKREIKEIQQYRSWKYSRQQQAPE